MAGAAALELGIGDPLTLAADGVLVPFFGDPGDAALLEVASPVGDNLGLHMFVFNSTCTRIGDSFFIPETVNDIAFLQLTGLGGVLEGVSGNTGAGLVALAQTDPSGFVLNPLPAGSPIHSRMYLFSTATGRSQIVEPIILDTAEFPGTNSTPPGLPHTWSPLRTAATFFAPKEASPISTSLTLICPRSTITGSGYLDPSVGFPAIVPGFPSGFSSDTQNGSLRARIYNTDEIIQRDVHFGCDCVFRIPVTSISNIYTFIDTYTEMEANPNPNNFTQIPGFTGYRSVSTNAVNDFFGRLSNGSRASIQGVVTDLR
jgi:hypothetical protein